MGQLGKDHVAACRYQGHVSAALVLGGVDFKGPHLFTVHCYAAVLPCTFQAAACSTASIGTFASLSARAVSEDGLLAPVDMPSARKPAA